MFGTCKLFGTKEELRESHIYPKFAVDYTKKTGSRFLRNFDTPNKRQQDGIKFHLLSDKAEKLFSTREKWFSENIFIPYLEQNQKHFQYNENLFYFAISFLWRLLLIETNDNFYEKEPYNKELLKVLEEWKLFLRDLKYPSTYDRIHIFFTDRIKDHNLGIEGVDHYMTRALDCAVIKTDDNKFLGIYGKFMRFVFFGIIRGGDENKLKETRINPVKGVFNIPQNVFDEALFSFFPNRIKQLNSLPQPSAKQQEAILNEILRDVPAFLSSDEGKSMINDRLNLDNNPSTNS